MKLGWILGDSRIKRRNKIADVMAKLGARQPIVGHELAEGIFNAQIKKHNKESMKTAVKLSIVGLLTGYAKVNYYGWKTLKASNPASRFFGLDDETTRLWLIKQADLRDEPYRKALP